MNNWMEITGGEIKKMHKARDLTGKGVRNLREMLRSIKKQGYKRAYNVRCRCMCGRTHSNMIFVRDWEQHPDLKIHFENDTMPRIMCPECGQAAHEYNTMGISDPKIVRNLLGWGENEGFAS